MIAEAPVAAPALDAPVADDAQEQDAPQGPSEDELAALDQQSEAPPATTSAPEAASAIGQAPTLQREVSGGPTSSAALDLLTAPIKPGDPRTDEQVEAERSNVFQAEDGKLAGEQADAEKGEAEAATAEAEEAQADSNDSPAPAQMGAAPVEGEQPNDVQADATGAVDAAAEDSAPEAAADASASGGGSSGGGEAVESTPPPPVPDVSGASPEQALGAVASLPPAQLAASLSGVAAAASRTVADQRAALVASPPEVARPSGAPATKDQPGAAAGVGGALAAAVRKAKERAAVALKAAKTPQLAASAPVERAPAPKVADAADGKGSPQAAENVKGAIRALPAGDPSLAARTGPAAQLPLLGDANPTQVDEQASHGAQAAGMAAAESEADAATPRGEDEIFPAVPAETLKAEVGGSSAGAAAPAQAAAPAAAVEGVGGEGGDEAASIVAQQEKGPEIQAAVAEGSQEMAAAKADQARQEASERQKASAEIAKAEQDNAAQQTDERGKAKAAVAANKREWRQEQNQLVTTHQAEAAKVKGEAHQNVLNEQQQAETQAADAHRQGDEEATEAQKQGEQEAVEAKKEGEKESSGGGFFSWAASAMKSLFDKVKSGIKAAFDKARAAVKAAIKKAQELATAVIEKARQAVVAAIKAAGAALIAISDTLLAAFPSVRDKFRKAIQDTVSAAENAVNKLAEGLKSTVKGLLDLLGKGLDAALGLLEKGLMAVVDKVAAVVKGAIDFAKNAIALLGTFAVLIKDIAKNPGKWLSMLGKAVVDGIKFHLWIQFKEAVKRWFNGKVEEVTGFGSTMWNLLKKGGMAFAQVAKMVWNGIVAAIPMALISILVEKLVSMIVPAAGALMLIIQGLQAAWGTIQKILAAIQTFVAFLKGVLSGQGPMLFAKAVAAAAVTVIEFVAQWLLSKLKGAAKGVGAKLKEIAKRIGQRLKAIAQKVMGGVKRAFGAVKRGASAVVGGIKRGAAALGRAAGKLGEMVARGVKGAAAALKAKWQALKARVADFRDRMKAKWEAWKAGAAERKLDRLSRGVDRAVSIVDSKYARRATSQSSLKLILLPLRSFYRLTSLVATPESASWEIVGQVNPTERRQSKALVSRIGKDKRLVSEAESAGKSVQQGLDSLAQQLSEGNLNPGIGTKNLFGSVSYARHRNGARLFFRVDSAGTVEILGKADKSNESRVIRLLKELYE